MSEFVAPDATGSLPRRQQAWTPPPVAVGEESGGVVGLPPYPLNLVELLDRACALYRRKFRSMIALSAVIYFLPGLIALRLFSTLLADGAAVISIGSASSSPVLGVLGSVANMIAIFTMGVAVAPVVAAAYEGRPTPKALAKPLLRRLPAAIAGALLGHLLLISVLVLIAFTPMDRDDRIALEVLVLFVTLFCQPFVLRMAPALAIEGPNPVKALRRSFSLTRKNYLRSMAAILLGGIVFVLATYALSLIPSAIFGSLAAEGLPYMWIPLGIVNYAVSAFVQPMVALTACMLYFDARMRREGYDVELLTERARDGR